MSAQQVAVGESQETATRIVRADPSFDLLDFLNRNRIRARKAETSDKRAGRFVHQINVADIVLNDGRSFSSPQKESVGRRWRRLRRCNHHLSADFFRPLLNNETLAQELLGALEPYALCLFGGTLFFRFDRDDDDRRFVLAIGLDHHGSVFWNYIRLRQTLESVRTVFLVTSALPADSDA